MVIIYDINVSFSMLAKRGGLAVFEYLGGGSVKRGECIFSGGGGAGGFQKSISIKFWGGLVIIPWRTLCCILHCIQITAMFLAISFMTAMLLAISSAGALDELFTAYRNFKVHFAQFPSPLTLKNVTLVTPFFSHCIMQHKTWTKIYTKKCFQLPLI